MPDWQLWTAILYSQNRWSTDNSTESFLHILPMCLNPDLEGLLLAVRKDLVLCLRSFLRVSAEAVNKVAG